MCFTSKLLRLAACLSSVFFFRIQSATKVYFIVIAWNRFVTALGAELKFCSNRMRWNRCILVLSINQVLTLSNTPLQIFLPMYWGSLWNKKIKNSPLFSFHYGVHIFYYGKNMIKHQLVLYIYNLSFNNTLWAWVDSEFDALQKFIS